MKRLLVFVGIALLLCSPVWGVEDTIRTIGWNVESQNADPDSIAARMAEMDGVEIWGLCEIDNSWVSTILEKVEAGGTDFDTIMGTTGRNTWLLLIIYNTEKYELISSSELPIYQNGYPRWPLVGHFRVSNTGNEFLYMVNHLYRDSADKRWAQSDSLNAWGRDQVLPVIAVGDYNYDWDVDEGDSLHDSGYDRLTKDGVFAWVKPDSPAATYYSSDLDSCCVLDFIFISWHLRLGKSGSEIRVFQNDFADSAFMSSHRPIWGEICIYGECPVGPEDGNPGLPLTFSLLQNHPNPFNSLTTISYSIPIRTHVSITIYDTMGRRINTIVDEVKMSGHHTAEWSGGDEQGNPAASGIYFYKIRAGEFEKTIKMVLMK